MTSMNSCELNFLGSMDQEQTSCDISARMRNNIDVGKAQRVLYRAIAFLNEIRFDNFIKMSERDNIANGLIILANELGR